MDSDRLVSPMDAPAAHTERSSKIAGYSETKFRSPELVGRSRALADVVRQAALVAPLDVSVLITGPSGSGKSALAKAIATNGPRAGRAFITLNCAALPDGLIESELFGAEPGAHSTATRRVQGKVSAAEGGTLLLDEISELSPTAQAKLLHLLQEREYYPLGATKAVRADVRIISATNAALDSLLAERRFRIDLYHRISVMTIAMPSLSQRRDDIADLVEHFAAVACQKHGFPHVRASAYAVEACKNADWPGQIRQLANVVEASVIRAAGAGAREFCANDAFPPADNVQREEPFDFRAATRRFQADYVARVLARNNWNVSDSARDLGLTRSHLYNLMEAFALHRSQTQEAVIPAPAAVALRDHRRLRLVPGNDQDRQ